MRRRLIIKVIAFALIANGLFGLLLAWQTWQLTQNALGDIRAAVSRLDPVQSGLSGGLRNLGGLVGSAGGTLGGYAQSISQAQAAVDVSATTSSQLADGFEQISLLGQVVVFGMQPFGALGEPFGASAASLRELSGSLRQTSTALQASARDTGQIGQELARLRSQVDSLASNVEAASAGFQAQSGIAQLEQAQRLMINLLIMNAALSLLVGGAILLLLHESAPSVVRAPVEKPDSYAGVLE
jgi:ABC-type transporter Mla subunit MlaD